MLFRSRDHARQVPSLEKILKILRLLACERKFQNWSNSQINFNFPQRHSVLHGSSLLMTLLAPPWNERPCPQFAESLVRPNPRKHMESHWCLSKMVVG